MANEFSSNAHKVTWNVLDDEYDGKEIELNFWMPLSSSRVEEAKRTVTVGKTKRVRLPHRMYFELDYSSAKDEDFLRFCSKRNLLA